MPLYGARADGNWSGSVWGLCDGVLRSDAQTFMAAAGEQVTQVFTLTNAVDYDGVYLWPSGRSSSPSGTLTVRLLKSGVAIATVTVNVSDLPPVGTSPVLDMGPVFFRFPANITGAGTNDYTVGVATSAASQVSFYRDATSANASRAVRRAVNATIIAGDDVIISGERTAGAMTNRTITYDVTATTDWGSASNSPIAVAVAVGAGGTLQSQLNAATNYRMTISGRFHLYWDGRFDIGTAGTPLPSDSTFFMLFDNTVNADFGFNAYAQYTLNMCHVKGFAVDGNGDSNAWAFLTSFLNFGVGTGAGSISVENTTGWVANDAIEIPATRLSGSGDDSLIIAAIASGTTLSTTANTGFLHDGSATPRTARAAVANRTRNIFIYSTSVSLQGFMNFSGGVSTAQTPQTPSVYMRGVVFANMGSATTGKRGFEVTAVGGSFEFDECVFRNFEVPSSTVRVSYRHPSMTVLFKNCIFFRLHSEFNLTAPSGDSDYSTTNRIRIQHCLFQRNISSQLVTINWPMFEMRRCVMSRPNTQGMSIAISERWLQDGSNVMQDNEIHLGQNNGGLITSGAYRGSMENWYIHRCGGGNVNAGALSLGFSPTWGEVVFTGLKIDGGTTGIRGITVIRGYTRIVSPEITGDSVGNLPCAIGLSGTVNSNGGSQGGKLIIEGGSILLTTTIIQPEVYASCRITLIGVTTTIAVDNASFYNLPARMVDGYVQALNHNNTAGQDRVWVPNGRASGATFVPDTTNFNTASPSLAIYPGSAAAKVKSPTFSAAVAQGQTATPSVRVREDAAYNGNPARLCVRRNALAGISSDTVIATHSGALGVWETLTGTTAAVARDCILEFYIDCDGTAGFINVDDFSCNSADTRGMQFYSENKLSPWVVGGSTGGGGATGFPLSRLVT